MQNQVFVCYSADDKNNSRTVIDTLRTNGHQLWLYEEQLHGSDNWLDRTLTAVRDSKAMVLFWSRGVLQSPYCIEEIVQAQKLSLPIFPCTVQGRFDRPMWLDHVQFTNMAAEPIHNKILQVSGQLYKSIYGNRTMNTVKQDLRMMLPRDVWDLADRLELERQYGDAYYYFLYLRDIRNDQSKRLQERINYLRETMIQIRKTESGQSSNQEIDLSFVTDNDNWVRIKAGSVKIRVQGAANTEAELRTVDDISYDFFMMRHPITVQQFSRFATSRDPKQKAPYYKSTYWHHSHAAFEWFSNHKHQEKTFAEGSDHPVTMVNWFESMAFINWLQDQTGDETLSLPTDAERLRAQQGDDLLNYPWGMAYDHTRCNVRQSRRNGTTPVGTYSPAGDSPFGVSDMVGNVWEWLVYYDSIEQGYKNLRTVESQAVQGGGWRNRPRQLFYQNPTFTRLHPPQYQAPDVGFRLIRL